MDWQQIKDCIKEELKATECMDYYCKKQPELFSENYEKFQCEKHKLEKQHTDCSILIRDLDEMLNSDLEVLKGKITSFYASLSPVTDESNEGQLSGFDIQSVQNPTADANTLMNKLDISDEKLEEEKAVTQKHVSYKMLDKFKNLKGVLRIIKCNQGTNFIQRKAQFVGLNARAFYHFTHQSANVCECATSILNLFQIRQTLYRLTLCLPVTCQVGKDE